MVTVNIIEQRDGETVVTPLGRFAGHVRAPIPGCGTITLEVITDEQCGILELPAGMKFKPADSKLYSVVVEGIVADAIKRGGVIADAIGRTFGLSKPPRAS